MSGSHRAWLAGDEKRNALRSVWAEWFKDYDAVLCPVLAVPAFSHQQDGDFFTRTIEINGADVPYLNLVTGPG